MLNMNRTDKNFLCFFKQIWRSFCCPWHLPVNMTEVHLTLILCWYISVCFECTGHFFTHKFTIKPITFPEQVSTQEHTVNSLKGLWVQWLYGYRSYTRSRVAHFMLAGAKKTQGNGGKRMEAMKKLLATMLMLINYPFYCWSL